MTLALKSEMARARMRIFEGVCREGVLEMM
jgi:hypothetical protein